MSRPALASPCRRSRLPHTGAREGRDVFQAVESPRLSWRGDKIPLPASSDPKTEMRGSSNTQSAMFSYVSLEERIPKHHRLRKLRVLVDTVLAEMDKEFEAVYAKTGRPSVLPERLLKAMLLQICLRSAPSVSWSRASTTTFCTAGLSVWRLMIRCGITPPSARTGLVCSTKAWCECSSNRSRFWPTGGD